MDNTKIVKMVENALVIIVPFAIIIVLFPTIQKMAEVTKKQTAETSTLGAFNMTKDYYTSVNLLDAVDLPFKVVYDKNESSGYTLYSANNKYTPSSGINLKIDGKLPESGSVEIKSDGEVEAKDLKFGNYVCNKKTISAPIVCVKNE